MNIIKLLTEPATFHKPIFNYIGEKLTDFYIGKATPATIKSLHAKI